MVLTLGSKETIRAHVQCDPGFFARLLREGIEHFLYGDVESRNRWLLFAGGGCSGRVFVDRLPHTFLHLRKFCRRKVEEKRCRTKRTHTVGHALCAPRQIAKSGWRSSLALAVSTNNGIVSTILRVEVGWQAALPMKLELAIFCTPVLLHNISAGDTVSSPSSRETDYTDRTTDRECNL